MDSRLFQPVFRPAGGEGEGDDGAVGGRSREKTQRSDGVNCWVTSAVTKLYETFTGPMGLYIKRQTAIRS